MLLFPLCGFSHIACCAVSRILDMKESPAQETSGPIIAKGKIFTGRGCEPKKSALACVIVAHDAKAGKELWRTRTIPMPGEPGDETWGGLPYEKRSHVGTWMVPSYDPELNLLYVGTSVTRSEERRVGKECRSRW